MNKNNSVLDHVAMAEGPLQRSPTNKDSALINSSFLHSSILSSLLYIAGNPF